MLGAHLEAAVETGVTCVYALDACAHIACTHGKIWSGVVVDSETFTSSFVRHLAATAEGLGFNKAAVLREAQLTSAELDDPDGRVPRAAHDRVWEAIVSRVGSEALAAAASARFHPQCFGVAGLLATSSETIGEMGRVFDRYAPLIGPRYLPPRVRASDATSTVFEFVFPPELIKRRERAETGTLTVLNGVRALTGDPFRPRQVRFQHARPPSVRAYDEWFGCRVTFGCPETQLVLPVGLDQPLIHADPGIRDFLERSTSALAARLRQAVSFASEVRNTLIRALPHGQPSIAHVARQHHVSERTLERYLHGEGKRFEDILDETRRELALIYLDEPSLAIAEIARLLGYGEPRSFFRAFRRWMEMSPAAYRRRERVN